MFTDVDLIVLVFTFDSHVKYDRLQRLNGIESAHNTVTLRILLTRNYAIRVQCVACVWNCARSWTRVTLFNMSCSTLIVKIKCVVFSLVLKSSYVQATIAYRTTEQNTATHLLTVGTFGCHRSRAVCTRKRRWFLIGFLCISVELFLRSSFAAKHVVVTFVWSRPLQIQKKN